MLFMKRDPDLLRELLLAIEATECCDPTPLPELADSSFPVVVFHAGLLVEADLLRRVPGDDGPGTFDRYALTWKGHDYLETIRDPVHWRIVRKAGERTGGWSAATIGLIARSLVLAKAQALGLPVHP